MAVPQGLAMEVVFFCPQWKFCHKGACRK